MSACTVFRAIACRNNHSHRLIRLPIFAERSGVVASLLLPGHRNINMPKRRNTSTAAQVVQTSTVPDVLPLDPDAGLPPAKRRAGSRKTQAPATKTGSTNPNKNANVLDAPEALRASPDATEKDESMDVASAGLDVNNQIKNEEETSIADLSEPTTTKNTSPKDATEISASAPKSGKKPTSASEFLDPEADENEEADEAELQEALSRPPPVHSDYLPLPWKGRLGYACLNTYLRFSNPPVFSSRTCRIASIIENRYPLTYPNEPPHATKNRPDRTKPADIRRGQAFVESLGKANARDIVKMLKWNDRYGIKFMRLSSEMFPFASHAEYGYKLAPFVSEELAEAGKVAAELGHRLTTHPGQYTQLGSPRKEVIENAIRDLEYHGELFSLLKLPPQQDRDAVMILHMGGVFGDKAATLDRFRENYARLSQNVKNRLVLENDDVSWSVHDRLPICEEMDIPQVLDFHHQNIIFDADKVREGTKDIVDLFPRILATWKRKNITPKMHYSEPTPSAITGRQRRKHNPRVATLPPCPPDMDLMIEAKDKEQAVFELMRTFKLPGYDSFNDMLPHVRKDDNKPVRTPAKKKTAKKTKAKSEAQNDDDDIEPPKSPETIPDDEVGMGGPEGRVYWPPGMEHWLRPAKRVVKPKETDDAGEKKLTPAQKKKAAASEAAKQGVKVEEEVQADAKMAEAVTPTPAKRKPLSSTKAKPSSKPSSKAKDKALKTKKGKSAKDVPTPSTSDDDLSDPLSDLGELSEEDAVPVSKKSKARGSRQSAASGGRQSGRSKRISYAEDDD